MATVNKKYYLNNGLVPCNAMSGDKIEEKKNG